MNRDIIDYPKRPIVTLLSGGLDSTTALALARDEGFEIYALTANYGQRQKLEVESARRIAKHFGVKEHTGVEIDLGRLIGGSALTENIAVPINLSVAEMEV